MYFKVSNVTFIGLAYLNLEWKMNVYIKDIYRTVQIASYCIKSLGLEAEVVLTNWKLLFTPEIEDQKLLYLLEKLFTKLIFRTMIRIVR